MNMQHDKKWFEDNFYGDQYDGKYDHSSACEYATDYHEHMMQRRFIEVLLADSEKHVAAEIDRLLDRLFELKFFESWEYLNVDTGNDKASLLSNIGFTINEAKN